MSNKAANETAVSNHIQVDVVEAARPSRTSTSEELLRRIATLLFILVAGLLTVFAYYASSLCITVVLAAFLAILVDPLVIMLEKLRLPRGVAAAVVVLAFIALIGLLGHDVYRRGTSLAEQLPVYTSKLQQAIEPHIIRGRPFGVRFECLAQTSPERSTLL
jgi:predicted PurR-regulated permease PerM